MNNSEIELHNKNIDIIDSVRLKNRFAIFSKIHNDPLFNNIKSKIEDPIFCCGKVISLNEHVHNFKINDLVLYFSNNQDLDIELSANLLVKLHNINNLKLISIIPYASFAMKILRKINPKIDNKVFIIGLNFFSILLKRIIDLSGADVTIIKIKDDSNEYNSFIDNKNIFDNIDEVLTISDSLNIDILISISELSPEITKHVNFKQKYQLNNMSIYDKGLKDLNYIKGIKYPYSYVRWDYRRNLEYVINLIKNNIIDLNYLEIIYIKINSINILKEKINKINENNLFLFEIIE